jgi:2-polyprenyl-3-methyl-5-hydroxy-6-metoxy-1,4-benzoquinol methylase
MKRLARCLAGSWLLAPARRLYARNRANWNLALTKWQKVQVGTYMLLADYARGRFPPPPIDEQTAFAAEKDFAATLTRRGMKTSDTQEALLRKPFWQGSACAHYLRDFGRLQACLHQLGVAPPGKLLEVGCGGGWMAEWCATMGFDVVATTIDPRQEELLMRRCDSLKAKGLPVLLRFHAAPMEYVAEQVAAWGPFDAVYVYEALHHAHDWQKAIRSVYATLRPGGWFLLCNEPNRLHTFSSYRLGRLSHTHEIGMNPVALRRACHQAGFVDIRILANRWHGWVRPIWLAACKGI